MGFRFRKSIKAGRCALTRQIRDRILIWRERGANISLGNWEKARDIQHPWNRTVVQ